MPRKTRILHGDDEYLFVESPGDDGGPALLIFARPENRRAVAPGRQATHQSEHGMWVPVARFDGEELLLAPDPPEGLGERLKGMLPRYASAQREKIVQAKNACFWISIGGRALHALHPAQPAGILLKLWRDADAAKRFLARLGEEGTVESTGDLREFLELRAEEGFAGALLDPDSTAEIVFFVLDEQRQIRFLKLTAGEGEKEPSSHLLDERGRWMLYEGDEPLEPYVDPEGWDRLMVRTYEQVPFLGYREQWPCFALVRDGAAATVVDPDGDGRARMVPLFHDPAAADEFRSRHHGISRAKIERVDDLLALVKSHAEEGIVARLHPGDHRVRSGTFWIAGDELVLDGFAGIWHSRDGKSFTPAE